MLEMLSFSMVGMERDGPGIAMAFSGWREAEEVGGVLFPAVVLVSWCCRDVSHILSQIFKRYIQEREREGVCRRLTGELAGGMVFFSKWWCGGKHKEKRRHAMAKLGDDGR